MKLTPPQGDMKLWTILWMILGAAGLYFGVADGGVRTIVFAVLQLIGAIGIWVGFPSAKWFLIAFFCIGIVGRLSVMTFYHFNPNLLPSLLFLIFCAVRFLIWKPEAEVPR